MCTATYIPLDKDSFLLTHSRDEKRERAKAFLPVEKELHGISAIFPVDGKALGTWIAASSSFTLCLLNGGFEKHIPVYPYKHSRGKIIPDFFVFNDPEKFVTGFSFEDIEPFTLIIIDSRSTTHLFQITWDGNKPHFRQIEVDQKHIWSSATLYDQEGREKRERWFSEFTSENRIRSVTDILEFHLSGDGDKDAVLMKREFHETVSITSVGRTRSSISFNYYDLHENKSYSKVKSLKETDADLKHS